MHQSIATINSPQFINLQPLDISPLMSSCEIKVLYLGENRNHSYISKDVAMEMAKTLRGAPIVGYYKNEKEDFADHGERIILDDEGIKFECLTVPYGFVSPDAKVWFQEFDDLDDFGNTIKREYLMTTGYLWTGQFEEARLAVEGDGRPQSMELDKDTLDGNWSTNSKTGMDFFIINDAIFSKLCILGEDVEPCFEGSTVTSPNLSTSFTKMDDDFTQTLYTMMQELRYALEGGQKDMQNVDTQEITPEVTEEFSETVDTTVENETVENEEITEGTSFTETTEAEEAPAPEADFVEKKEEEKEDSQEEEKEETDSKEDKEDSEEETEKKDNEEDKKKYSLLEEKYSELEAKFTALEAENAELKQYKESVENQKKDDLIKSFYMLDDEEKKEILQNKAMYSLDEIESKLSVIYTRKSMAMELEAQDSQESEADVTTYTVTEADVVAYPDWIKAAIEVENNL